MNHYTIKKMGPKILAKGVKIRVIPGKKMTVVFFNLDPGAVVPGHSHPHEQIGTVLKGSLELTVDNETRTMKAGDVYHIPSNSVHSGKVIDETEVYEVFCPPREDYLTMYE